MKLILRTMQIMMVVVLIFSVYHLFNFFATSATARLSSQKNEDFRGSVSPITAQDMSAAGVHGKALFNANCASCHKIDKDLTGPALMGVEDRWPDKTLLYSWIRNNKAVLKSGDKYANNLFKQWNKTAMNLFPNLTDQDIAAILSYLKMYKPQQYAYEVMVCL